MTSTDSQQKVLGQDSCQEEQDLAISWVRSWPKLGRHNLGQDLGQESCPRTFCWDLYGMAGSRMDKLSDGGGF